MKLSFVEKVVISIYLLIIIGSGIAPEYLCFDLDENWFQRSGSLLVCLGIVLAVLDLTGKLDKLHTKLINDFTQVKEWNKQALDRKQIENLESEKNIVDSEVRSFTRSIKKLREQGAKRLLFLEGFILFSGTLVWGYGDLLAKHLTSQWCIAQQVGLDSLTLAAH